MWPLPYKAPKHSTNVFSKFSKFRATLCQKVQLGVIKLMKYIINLKGERVEALR